MTDMMKLVIGWTIVGAFVFTTMITCLSLVGWLAFKVAAQQKKLFQALIVEVVVLAGASVLGGVRLDPRPVAKNLRADGANEALVDVTRQLLASDRADVAVDKEVLKSLVARIQPRAGTPEAEQVETLRVKVDALPAGTLNRADATTIGESEVLQPAALRRAIDLRRP